MEIRYIPGYEGKYSITKDGRVYSHPKPLTGFLSHTGRNKPGRWMNPSQSRGYFCVNLGASNTHLVHRLVAQTFIPPIEGKTQINHINGNKKDNRVDNLEWCTQTENNLHAWKTGLSKPKPKKLSKNDEKEIVGHYSSGHLTYREIAHFYNVGASTIKRVIEAS